MISLVPNDELIQTNIVGTYTLLEGLVNIGPYQFPEKLIPQIIFNAISGKSLPI